MNQPGIKDVLGSEPKLIKEPAKFNGHFRIFSLSLILCQKINKQ